MVRHNTIEFPKVRPVSTREAKWSKTLRSRAHAGTAVFQKYGQHQQLTPGESGHDHLSWAKLLAESKFLILCRRCG